MGFVKNLQVCPEQFSDYQTTKRQNMMELLPYIVIAALSSALGFVIGILLMANQYSRMYIRMTAEIIDRMSTAMKSLCFEQSAIDSIVHRMGCKIMPPGVPAPPKGNAWADGHEPERNKPKL